MPKMRDSIRNLQRVPATYFNTVMDAIGEMTFGFLPRIKPGSPTVLQVPASADGGRALITIRGRPRWVESNVEIVGSGAARTVEVWATAAENRFGTTTVDRVVVETDETVYSFALELTNVAGTPRGALARKVGTAVWDGTRFTSVTPGVGVGAVANDPRFSDQRVPLDESVTEDKLSSALQGKLGVSSTTVRRRGLTTIDTEQATTSTTLTSLPTPDVVRGIVLPTDGLLFVLFRGLWRLVGASNAAAVALTLNGVPATTVVPDGAGVAAAIQTALGTNGTSWSTVFSSGESGTGLRAGSSSSSNAGTSGNLWSNGATGTALAGVHGWSPIVIEAPAGTYDVGVVWRVGGGGSGGTLSAKNRKLRVWTQGF